MNSVKYSRVLTLALLLGTALCASASKMIELDGQFVMKKANLEKTKMALHHKMRLYGKKEKELPPKNNTKPSYQEPEVKRETDVVYEDNYFEKAMEDYYDVQLFSKVYVGSNRQPFDLILDTGSAWTWVQGQNCRTCPTYDRFDFTESTTYVKQSNKQEYIYYGTGTVRGNHGQDTVCLAQNTCAQNVSILVLNYAWDLEGLYADGIMGMSPTSQHSGAELVIEEMHEQGVIEDKVFSIQVGNLDEPSKITIGGYDVEKYAKGDLHWHDLANKLYWTINMDHVSLAGEKLDIETREVIVDSGTSYLLMPTDDFQVFSGYFQERYTCWTDASLYGLYVCNCDSSDFESYPNLDFTIDGHTYTMTSENYVERYGSMCVFKIMQMDFNYQSPFWIMGLTFFHNYYTVFDQQNSRIGFAESKLSNLPEQQNITIQAAVNLHTITTESSYSGVVMTIGALIALIGLFILGQHIVKGKKAQKKMDCMPEVNTREVLLAC